MIYWRRMYGTLGRHGYRPELVARCFAMSGRIRNSIPLHHFRFGSEILNKGSLTARKRMQLDQQSPSLFQAGIFDLHGKQDVIHCLRVLLAFS